MSSARQDFEQWLPAMEERALNYDVEFLVLIRKQLPLIQVADAWQMQFWTLAQHLRDVAKQRIQGDDDEVLAGARCRLLKFLCQGIRYAASPEFRRAVDHFCIAGIFELWSAELQRRDKAVDVSVSDDDMEEEEV